MKENERK